MPKLFTSPSKQGDISSRTDTFGDFEHRLKRYLLEMTSSFFLWVVMWNCRTFTNLWICFLLKWHQHDVSVADVFSLIADGSSTFSHFCFHIPNEIQTQGWNVMPEWHAMLRQVQYGEVRWSQGCCLRVFPSSHVQNRAANDIHPGVTFQNAVGMWVKQCQVYHAPVITVFMGDIHGIQGIQGAVKVGGMFIES